MSLICFQKVRENWIKLYDPDFIDNVVIKGIEDHLPLIADLLATVSKKATGKVSELISSVNKDLAGTQLIISALNINRDCNLR